MAASAFQSLEVSPRGAVHARLRLSARAARPQQLLLVEPKAYGRFFSVGELSSSGRSHRARTIGIFESTRRNMMNQPAAGERVAQRRCTWDGRCTLEPTRDRAPRASALMTSATAASSFGMLSWARARPSVIFSFVLCRF